MKIHRQSSSEAIVTEQGELVGYRERRRHIAIDAACPRCDARPGGPCKHGDDRLPPLSVHLERMEAFI